MTTTRDKYEWVRERAKQAETEGDTPFTQVAASTVTELLAERDRLREACRDAATLQNSLAANPNFAVWRQELRKSEADLRAAIAACEVTQGE